MLCQEGYVTVKLLSLLTELAVYLIKKQTKPVLEIKIDKIQAAVYHSLYVCVCGYLLVFLREREKRKKKRGGGER